MKLTRSPQGHWCRIETPTRRRPRSLSASRWADRTGNEVNRDDDKISIEEMADALNRSGYLLETRVEDALVDAAFTVEANTCYVDPITGKSRELDIYAFNLEPVDPEREDKNDIVSSVVLCECSNNSQPLVFLSKDWASTPFDSEKVHVSG